MFETNFKRSHSRTLAIVLTPFPGESLIGMVARGTRLNVLGRTAVILEEAGLQLLHPGTVGQDIVDCERLAVQLGCSTHEIENRRHSYLKDPTGPADVRWGDGALFRADILVQTRRVSPLSLRDSDHHRAAWMNQLLPYCPESFELLIEKCATCGRTQGWRHAWGIGYCDDIECRARLSHPTADQLPDSLRDDYRFFSDLVSMEPAARHLALSRLHPAVAELPPAVLVNLALQLGAAIQEHHFILHRGTIRRLSPHTIATTVSRGASLLREWPTRFREAIAKELASPHMVEGRRKRAALHAIRRLGLPRSARPEQLKLVRSAVPEAFEHAATALTKMVKPAVGANFVCRSANISMSELRSIREAGFIKHEVVVPGKRAQVQFDEADAKELVRRKRESIFASRLEQSFGIPRYACEQLACLGVVQREAHPALALIHPTMRLVESSTRQLLLDLEALRQTKPKGLNLIPLGTAVRVIGGRPKPWGVIVEAMRNGSLRFWLDGEGKFVRRALVQVADIVPFGALGFDEGTWPEFPFQQHYSQVDAAEILNLDALQIRRVIAADQLSFRPDGVALIADRDPVLHLAKNYIATAEISLRTKTPFISVPRLMAAHPDIGRCAAGWVRSQFDATFGSF